MSYCSLEEAWGGSFEQIPKEAPAHGHSYSRDTSVLPNHNGEPNRVQIAPVEVDEEYLGQFSSEVTNHDFQNVMSTTTIPSAPSAPSAPTAPSTPSTVEKSSGSVATSSEGSWQEVSNKLEKLIMILTQTHSKKPSSWPDTIIYFLTGVFAILILWCFFSIGKWIGTKSLF